ncbi:unnamed protein product [Timema podura]|uniref:NFX1-type zinc finger-containing protein 1 n=1 Tax=Timema podura TaxID=61482 RepID=A0ABN7NU13_TIMPD|nr:unnamed protein product [Timema podura]
MELPNCKHIVDIPCGADPLKFDCPFKCEDRLMCGHACDKTCHPLEDPEHLECKKKCARLNKGCSRGHKCRLLCYQECVNCSVILEPQTLTCGHSHKLKCSQDPATVKCAFKCNRTLPCGHPCASLCHEACAPCVQRVTKIIPDCGHKGPIPGYIPPRHSMIFIGLLEGCFKQWILNVYCGKLTSGAAQRFRVKTAQSFVRELWSADTSALTSVPRSAAYRGVMYWYRAMFKQRAATLETSFAAWRNQTPPKITSDSTNLVGGDPGEEEGLGKKLLRFLSPLGFPELAITPLELLQYCEVPCGAALECGHACHGSCRACLQGRIHARCKEKCGKTLICGHRYGLSIVMPRRPDICSYKAST